MAATEKVSRDVASMEVHYHTIIQSWAAIDPDLRVHAEEDKEVDNGEKNRAKYDVKVCFLVVSREIRYHARWRRERWSVLVLR